jgi:hypothetical protein
VINRSALVDTAYCLLPCSDPRSTIPDFVTQVMQLSPVETPVGCFRLGALSGGPSPIQGEVTCSVRTAQNKQIEITLIPTKFLVESPLGLTRQLLFFFHPALDPTDRDASPYTLTLQDQIPRSLAGIAGGDGDWLSLTSDRSENTEIVDIVVFLPTAYSRVVLSNHELASGVNVAGRKMSGEELNYYGQPPPGFVAVGWRACDVKVGQNFGVYLRMPRR